MSAVVLTWPQREQWPMDRENDIYETGTDGDRHVFIQTYIMEYQQIPNIPLFMKQMLPIGI